MVAGLDIQVTGMKSVNPHLNQKKWLPNIGEKGPPARAPKIQVS